MTTTVRAGDMTRMVMRTKTARTRRWKGEVGFLGRK
jgi:hypothetical protein